MVRLDCNLTLQPRSGIGQRWLLGALVVALLGLLSWREALLDRISAQQKDLARLHARAEHARRLAGAFQPQSLSPAALTELNATASDLTRPWEAPLDSLRKTAGRTVTLDKIQPDPATNRFNIRGRAATTGEYLKFMQRLQSSAAWRHVQPVSDEPESANTPSLYTIRFEMTGQWGGT